MLGWGLGLTCTLTQVCAHPTPTPQRTHARVHVDVCTPLLWHLPLPGLLASRL